jgi:hypothetical protein
MNSFLQDITRRIRYFWQAYRALMAKSTDLWDEYDS